MPGLNWILHKNLKSGDDKSDKRKLFLVCKMFIVLLQCIFDGSYVKILTGQSSFLTFYNHAYYPLT